MTVDLSPCQTLAKGGVTYREEPWHKECFVCTNCKTQLAGQHFTSRDDSPYCLKCFGSLYSKKCEACSKPITGKIIITTFSTIILTKPEPETGGQPSGKIPSNPSRFEALIFTMLLIGKHLRPAHQTNKRKHTSKPRTLFFHHGNCCKMFINLIRPHPRRSDEADLLSNTSIVLPGLYLSCDYKLYQELI